MAFSLKLQTFDITIYFCSHYFSFRFFLVFLFSAIKQFQNPITHHFRLHLNKNKRNLILRPSHIKINIGMTLWVTYQNAEHTHTLANKKSSEIRKFQCDFMFIAMKRSSDSSENLLEIYP